MKSKFTWIFTLFMVLAVQLVSAQEKTVTGTVTDADFKDPLPGVSVMLEGTQFGTETDMDGKYSIKAKPGQRLVFEYAGFKQIALTVGQSDVLNAEMAELTDELDVVIIDNYREVSQEQSSVAAATVTSKTIEGRPNPSLIQNLQGQVAGLNISTGSGQPGSDDTTVILRGLGSINGAVEPLFIIDGIPASSARYRSLNPNDVDNVTVLKDAGATAIYGNRGANGVIVITTKRAGFDTDLEVRYSGNTGVSFTQDNQYNLMNAKEYLDFIGRNSANAQDGNWDEYFLREGIGQNHTLSFSAGAKNLSSYTSVGFSDMEGIMQNTAFKRFTFRNNMQGRSNNGRLTYNTTVNAALTNSDMVTGTGGNGVNQNLFWGAFTSRPDLLPSDYVPGFANVLQKLQEHGMGSMPYLLMDKLENDGRFQDEVKLLVNGGLSYDLGKGFSAGTTLGVDYQTINQNSYQSPWSFNSLYFAAADQDWTGYVSEINERRVVINANTNLKWSKTFNDKHTVGAALFVEYLKAHYRNSSLSKEGFDPIFFDKGNWTGSIPDNEDNDFYVPSAGLSVSNAGLFSYFGVFNYDYDSRYGVEATIRRDASFRFVDDNRWGTFWALSGRWNISNEKFMDGSRVSDLKLRASYGTAGNQDITGGGLFGGANLYETLYASGFGYNNDTSLVLSQLPNRELQWETITTANIGLDYGFFDNRLRGSVDVYSKKTEDLYQGVPLSSINATSTLMSNFGSLKNEGIEFLVAADVVRNDDLRVTINFNGAYNKNTILELPNEDGFFWNGSSLSAMNEGDMLGQFYMFKYAGVDEATGDALYYDRNGDLTNEPLDEDRHLTGKTYMPKYQGSFGFDVAYKGWFATANFTYAQDLYRFDNDYYFFMHPSSRGVQNMSNDALGRWTSTNTENANYPNYSSKHLDKLIDSDYYLQDASYIRLRYISLGYNFTEKQLGFMGLKGMRVYGQAENLLTWTKWRGWDAESNRGVDMGQYPTPRTVSFGVEVQF